MELDLQIPLLEELATLYGNRSKSIRYFDSRRIHIWIKQLSTRYHENGTNGGGGHGGHVISRRKHKLC